MFTDHFAFDASENPDFGGVSITSLNVNLLTPPQKHALRPRRRGFATSNSSKPAFLRLNRDRFANVWCLMVTDQPKRLHFSDSLGCDKKLQNSMLKMDSS